jgi:hypothetical protein
MEYNFIFFLLKKYIMYPHLVEKNILYVMKDQLLECNKTKFYKNSLIFNGVLFVLLFSIISIILNIKYTGKQDKKKMLEKENNKKNYILSKLQFYQKIKTKEYTNMPI